MTAPADAILARRRLTNRFIGAHDAPRLKPFVAADARVIVGDGGLLLGSEAILRAFAAQFADPDFITYLREPEAVELNAAADRAAERGRWAARWKAHESSGTYLAVWCNSTGQWRIESELYVTLG